MKKSIKIIKVLLLFVIVSLYSCSYQAADENIISKDKGVPQDDYWPTTIGNEWVINQDGIQSSMKIISSKIIDGETYYKFNQIVGQGVVPGATAENQWLKKVNGDYIIKIQNISVNFSGNKVLLSDFQHVLFKDYLEVDQTWNDSYDQTILYPGLDPIKTTVYIRGTIVEKGATITVNGIVYNDVIKFRMHQEALILGSVASIDLEFWFAKKIGFVKMSSLNSTTQLVSYTLK